MTGLGVVRSCVLLVPKQAMVQSEWTLSERHRRRYMWFGVDETITTSCAGKVAIQGL